MKTRFTSAAVGLLLAASVMVPGVVSAYSYSGSQIWSIGSGSGSSSSSSYAGAASCSLSASTVSGVTTLKWTAAGTSITLTPYGTVGTSGTKTTTVTGQKFVLTAKSGTGVATCSTSN